MRFRFIILAAAMALTLVACGSVKDTKFTGDNTEEVIDTMLKSDDLTETEKVRLTLVIGKAQAMGEDLSGKTIGDLLEESEEH